MINEALEINLNRMVVQMKDGRITSLGDLDHFEEIYESLGMIMHGWERTAQEGEVVISEFITDTGYLIQENEIIRDNGVSTCVNLPTKMLSSEDVKNAAEASSSGGLLNRGGLSTRRKQYLVNNASTVAGEVNRIFRQVVTEFWIGWYSAEGIPLGIDGVYELDYANGANHELYENLHEDQKSRLVDETRLTSDQAEAVLRFLPETIPIKVDVFCDGEQIL